MIELLSSGAVMTEEVYEAEGRQFLIVVIGHLCVSASQEYQIRPCGPPALFIEGNALWIYTVITS